MRRTATIATLSLVVLALAGPAFAGGFRIPEQGAAAMGLANAFVGQADDPSAVQFNPAGLVQVPGSQIQLGGTYITVQSDYARGSTTGSMKDTVAVPPAFYYSNHLGEGPFWLGLGITAPFGLGTEWDVPDFRFFLTKTDLQMVKLNPALAYRASDRFSVGLGVDYYQVLEAKFEQWTPVPADVTADGVPDVLVDGYQALSADGTALGWNVGGLYKVSNDLSVGFCYRTGPDINLEGDVSVSVGGIERASGKGETTLHLPPTAALGIAWKPTPKMGINLDLDWTGWTAYDELVIETSLSPTPTVSRKDYKDTTAIRLGARYALSDAWTMRGGFMLDATPVPEETFDGRLPDGDRWGASLGAGWKKGPWSVDFAGMYVDVGSYDVAQGVVIPPGFFSPYGRPPYSLPYVGNGAGTLQPNQTVDGNYDGSITLLACTVGYAF